MTDIEVRYKCACMPAEQPVMVPQRKADEDVADWMQLCVGPAMYLHHRRASPTCAATKSEYVKIPYRDGRIGDVPVNH